MINFGYSATHCNYRPGVKILQGNLHGLLQLTSGDFTEQVIDNTGGDDLLAPLSADHEPFESPDWQVVKDGIRKRRQRQCKVCSILKRKVGERRTSKLYLCNKASQRQRGSAASFIQIWYNRWENGTKRPRPRCGRDIQTRAASTGGGKKSKRRGQ
ncbi:Hypothetical protein PHPALM_2889, partial [Phytophthora palmivora]